MIHTISRGWLPVFIIAFWIVDGGTMSAQQSEEDGSPKEKVEGKIILQNEYIEDSNGRTFHDPSIFLSLGQVHLQVWGGEFTKGVEIGGFLRDARRSAYSAFYRFRDDFDHVVQVGTEQILGRGFVGFAGLRYIRIIPSNVGDRDLLQPAVGLDKYYGDYHFFSFRALRDPRDQIDEDDRYSFVLSNRWATHDKYLTLGLVPRTDGSTGWFVQGKWRWLRAGYGRFNRFDFTNIDRDIVNLGVELEF